MSLKNIAVLLILASLTIGCNSGSTSKESEGINFSDDNGGITLPEGFKAVVVADSLGVVRHLTVRDNGDVYVILREPNEEGQGMAALRDADGDGRAEQAEYFGDISGTGIKIYDGYLYASSTTSVIRYPLKDNELVPSSQPDTVIKGFPEQNSHAAKSFTFDDKGNIYINVGAPSNACQEKTRTPGSKGQNPCPQLERQGGIWKFGGTALGQTQQDDGHRYATGIRNAVALDWNPDSNNLYALQHGRDQLSQLWPDYFSNEASAELPAEEFFLIRDGSDFGWPYTYYDHRKGAKMLAPEYGGDGGKVAEKGKYEDPIMAFPGHWAPNGLLFYTGDQFPDKYQGGAFIAFHGSWNRAPLPQEGYNVTYVPFDGETPSGDYEIFADGFKGADTLRSPGEARHRPMGLAMGPDGSLYISDSKGGRIWRVMYTGNK